MSLTQENPHWSLLRKISFRFAFIYYILYFSGEILNTIPWIGNFLASTAKVIDLLVYPINDLFLHIPNLAQVFNGSGDTSFHWALLFTFLLLSTLGTLIWSYLDRKKAGYPKLYYLLCLLVRFSLAAIAFSYGILKVFAMQMYFPNLSQLATPLGDFLPMRFSWLFIGYSTPYQVFSGVAEVLVALLLLWRRTALLGALMAVGVFANVAMLNLSYDIPVKIYSINLLIASMFLVWQERERLFAFFLQNTSPSPSQLYTPKFQFKWFTPARIILKIIFVIGAFVLVGYNYFDYYTKFHSTATRVLEPIDPGIYQVETFVKNGDTIPENLSDPHRWKDVVFDYNAAGSVGTNDSTFRMRYGRAYFDYRPDSLGKTLEWRTFSGDSLPLITFQMEIVEAEKINLRGVHQQDSIYLVLKKLPKHHPLTERQFHWVSESNR